MTVPMTTILGIGNVLWADEGFGVRAVEALNRSYEFADSVSLVDGGTQGLYLVPLIQSADLLVVFDAIDYGLPAGTLRLIEGEDVPNFMGAKKMSLHQTGFQEVLAMSELLGDYPEEILLIGVQPAELEDYGGSLRKPVQDQIQPAIEAAIAWLQPRGVQATPRRQPLPEQASLHAPSLNQDAYETLRPSADSACRIGDVRVLQDDRLVFDPKTPEPDAGTLSVPVDARQRD